MPTIVSRDTIKRMIDHGDLAHFAEGVTQARGVRTIKMAAQILDRVFSVAGLEKEATAAAEKLVKEAGGLEDAVRGYISDPMGGAGRGAVTGGLAGGAGGAGLGALIAYLMGKSPGKGALTGLLGGGAAGAGLGAGLGRNRGADDLPHGAAGDLPHGAADSVAQSAGRDEAVRRAMEDRMIEDHYIGKDELVSKMIEDAKRSPSDEVMNW